MRSFSVDRQTQDCLKNKERKSRWQLNWTADGKAE